MAPEGRRRGLLTVGVRAFVAERLREALDVRCRTAKDVASTMGISTNSLSRYVRGRSAPQPTILNRLAAELQLPEAYFLRPTVSVGGSPVFYRSLVAATKRARASAEVRYGWLRESWAYLQQHVQFPEVDFPDLNPPNDPEAISDQSVEQAANHVREVWGLGRGPIANMVKLLEAHGAIVTRVDLGSSRLDAFSQWAQPENRPFVVLNADKDTAVRSRWDAAHELGHMLLHRNVPLELLHRAEVFKRAEQQAHRFAGAFLLPADTFGRTVYVPTLSVLAMQKRIWGVSIAAMLKRMHQLRLISSEHATRIWRSYSRQGMRLREPGDDVYQPERPEVLRRAYEMMVRERVISRQQFLAALPFDQTELQTLLGLSMEFHIDRGPSLHLRDGRGKDISGPAQNQETRVIPLRQPKRMAN